MTSGRIRMRHLRCFLAVARLGSVTRAAEDLNTVQPSVSRSLRELEEELATPLFDRTATGLVMNAAGHSFFRHVSTGLGQIDRGLEVLRGELAEQRVVVYALPNVVRVIMPGAVARFKTLNPEVSVELMPWSSGGLQNLLRQGEVDFGFGRLLAAEHLAGMNFEHLYSEALQFFVRKGHPLDGATAPGMTDLGRYPVILPTRGTIIRQEIDRFLISQGGSSFPNRIETISYEFARNIMPLSDAVVCAPHGAMEAEIAGGRAAIVDFGRDDLIASVGVTSRVGKDMSPAAQLLIQAIRDEVADRGLS